MAPGRTMTVGESTAAFQGVRPGAIAPRRSDLIDHCRKVMAERGLTTAAPRSVIDDLVAQVLREQRVVGPTELATELAVSLTGWGPIQELLDTADCEEIWWNDPSRVFYSVAGQTRLSNVVLAPADAEAMVLRAVSAAGRRLDHSQPFVDAPLPDGSRLHVVMPPITPEHWAVNIRRYVVHPTGLDPLVESGTLTRPAAELLNAAVRAGANIVICGGTGSGKTTMLNALLCSAPGHRVVTCEEVRELRLPIADWVTLQTRDGGLEGTGAVVLRDLVREALRMRPDRLVVGEVRGPEALDLLLAMNCGIPAAGTVHANSAEDAVDRLTGLPLLAGPNVSAEFVRRCVGSCLDLIVHLELGADGHRRVTQIVSVAPTVHGPSIGRLFHDDGAGLRRGAAEIPAPWVCE